MKAHVTLALASIANASAFAPGPSLPLSGSRVARRPGLTTLDMAIDSMLGADVETNGLWDPLGLSNTDEETLNRYRAAELKHGRVAMLAVVGELAQGFFQLPDPVFSEVRPLSAFVKVFEERPLAVFQIALFIALMELFAFVQEEDRAPGDVAGEGWARYKDPEVRDDKLTKELKNGRLAMVAILGMWAHELVTGQGPVEQIAANNLWPF